MSLNAIKLLLQKSKEFYILVIRVLKIKSNVYKKLQIVLFLIVQEYLVKE